MEDKGGDKEIEKMNGEFSFIRRFFAPLSGNGSWGLTDDAAMLAALQPESRFVVSVDNLAEDVHFFSNDPPDMVAKKILRRNLSDMAAMGAAPRGYFLSLAFDPKRIEIDKCFESFQKGLEEDQKKYGFSLLGGDTTRIKGKIFLSVTIFGEVKKTEILRRSGALPEQELWVTGTIGAPALGLAAREGRIPDLDGILAQHYLLPDPPVNFLLGGIASSAIDISDGLMQDAGHLAEMSGVKLVIESAAIPLLPQAEIFFKSHQSLILEGGDDYQLLFAIDSVRVEEMLKLAKSKDIPVTRIGHVFEGKGVFLKDSKGQEKKISGKGGWQHF